MGHDFTVPRGIDITNLSGIQEGYTIDITEEGYALFEVNISADNIKNTFYKLATLVKPPCFMVIEIPTSEEEEDKIRLTDNAPYYNDLYYYDDIEPEKMKEIFEKYQDFFIHDGLINFGFGSHEGFDEIFIGKYKIGYIYADEPNKYMHLFAAIGVERLDTMRTVWENFDDDNPGSRFALDFNEKSIYNMIEELKEDGFYFAERRPE